MPDDLAPGTYHPEPEWLPRYKYRITVTCTERQFEALLKVLSYNNMNGVAVRVSDQQQKGE